MLDVAEAILNVTEAMLDVAEAILKCYRGYDLQYTIFRDAIASKKITGKYAERGFHDPVMFRICHQLHLPFPLKNIMTGHDRDPAC